MNQRQPRTRDAGLRHDENDDHNRDEFISSFQLGILSTSAPVLVRNDIRKLHGNPYGARITKEYFRNSNPHNLDIKIVQIWKVHNVSHYAKFMQQNYDKVDNCLLWHGTSRQNLISILQNNLKMPTTPSHGHMFGPGVYFADRMSKSGNYTDQSGPKVLLLCQVALGKKYRVLKAEKFYSAPGNYDTIKAVGKNVPDNKGEKMFGKYCRVPCGPTINHPDPDVYRSSELQYNEYIVFDQNRIRIKFILHCERGSLPISKPLTNSTPVVGANARSSAQGRNRRQRSKSRQKITATANNSVISSSQVQSINSYLSQIAIPKATNSVSSPQVQSTKTPSYLSAGIASSSNGLLMQSASSNGLLRPTANAVNPTKNVLKNNGTSTISQSQSRVTVLNDRYGWVQGTLQGGHIMYGRPRNINATPRRSNDDNGCGCCIIL